MSEWRTLLTEAVQRGNVTTVAGELGVSRTAVSLLMAGKYPGNTERMAERIIAAFGHVACVAHGDSITRVECAVRQGLPMPTSSPNALRRWRVCQHCQHHTRTL